MKFVKISAVVLFCGLCLAVGASSARESANAASSPTAAADKGGRELYAQNCARCHGADGRGQTELGRDFDTPDISTARWQRRHSDAKIARAIAKGGGGMPAFGKKLSQKEIAALTAHVRTLKK